MSDTTIHLTPGSHVPDGALVALLDGERLPADAQFRAHVDGCGYCATRLDAIRRRGMHVSAALAAADVPANDAAALRARLGSRATPAAPRWWRHPTVRAAAGILVVAGLAAATPIGRRVFDAARGLMPTSGTSAPEPAPAATPASRPPAAGTRVAFAPGGRTLTIRFATRQAQGIVELLPDDAHRASAQITAGAADEELLVLPGELRIVNSPGSSADYRVTAPAALQVILIAGVDTLFTSPSGSAHRFHMAW